jgi:hypothetical protein
MNISDYGKMLYFFIIWIFRVFVISLFLFWGVSYNAKTLRREDPKTFF